MAHTRCAGGSVVASDLTIPAHGGFPNFLNPSRFVHGRLVRRPSASPWPEPGWPAGMGSRSSPQQQITALSKGRMGKRAPYDAVI